MDISHGMRLRRDLRQDLLEQIRVRGLRHRHRPFDLQVNQLGTAGIELRIGIVESSHLLGELAQIVPAGVAEVGLIDTVLGWHQVAHGQLQQPAASSFKASLWSRPRMRVAISTG